MRALIVDDEPTVRLLLSRILARDFDCEASAASNGIEALDLLGRERYDFMLLDLLMPGMGGFETLHTIRRNQQLQHLPVVVMSTVREEARVREAIELGVGTYMTKPLRPMDVTQRLTRFVARLGTSGAIAAPSRSCGGLQPGARVLVVDDDRDFRHFVRGVLSPEYSVATAANCAQGLRMAMDHPPGMIIVGPQLGAIRGAVFIEKLRALPRLNTVPVVASVAGTTDARPADTDATITRTLVPETFRQQFDALVSAGAERGARTHDTLGARPHLVTLTEQVVGMNLGVQVVEDPAGLPAVAGDAVASVSLDMAQPAGEYRLLLRASTDVARAFAQRARRQPDVDDDAIAATVRDVTRTLGSRLLGALRGAGAAGELGEVASTTWTEPDRGRDGATVVELGFGSTNGELRFSVLLRALPPGRAGSVVRLP